MYNKLVVLLLLLLISCTSHWCLAQHRIFPLHKERFQNALQTEKEAILKKDSLLLAEAYYLYGKTYTIAGDYNTSKSYFLKSLRILEPRGDSYELGRLYIRFVESPLEPLAEKIRFTNLSLAVFKRIGSLKGQTIAYQTLGEMFHRKSNLNHLKFQFDSAVYYYGKAEKLAYQIKDTVAIADANIRLGNLYLEIDKPKAIFYLEKALEFFTLKESVGAAINTMIILANLYINSGQLNKGHFTILRAQQIMTKKNKLDDYPLLMGLDKALINYYEKDGQWQNAFKQYQEMHSKEASQFQDERDRELLKLQVEYETSKKESQLKAQQKELVLNNKILRTQRNFIILTVVLLALASTLSILFFRLYRKNQRTSNKNAQLVREQNHRVKNNLQMVSSLLNMQARLLLDSDAKKAVEESRLRVQSMAIIQRKLYDEKSLLQVNLANYIPELSEGILRTYGYSEAMTNYDIDAIELDTDKAIPIGLILTEIITNSCKYAFPDNAHPVLSFLCKLQGKEITISVSDNGPGLKKKNPASDTFDTMNDINYQENSFGMQLVKLQVQQLYGSYMFSSEKGTTFSMKFRN